MDWENLINGLTLLGIPLVVAIPLIISAFRAWGVSERWTGPLAVVLGILGLLLVQIIAIYPSSEAWIKVVVYGLLLGLASNGAYSQYKMWKSKLDPQAPAGFTQSKTVPGVFSRIEDDRDTLLNERLYLIDKLKAYVPPSVYQEALREAQAKAEAGPGLEL